MLLSRSLKLAILGMALFAAGCDRQSGQKAQPQPSGSAPASGEVSGTVDRSHKRSPLPASTLNDPAGNKLALPSLKGKPTLINLWATWCAPCIAELPTLNAISNRADMNVRIVTVSQDIGEPAKVQAFLDQKGFAQLPAWLDPQGDLAAHYQVQTLPTSIYYDANGLEVWR
ncbi:MAG: redoxin domain-containing protein, partial [Novosphingobium sp.]